MAKELRQIAIYGKGGIGKSTTTQNLDVRLSHTELINTGTNHGLGVVDSSINLCLQGSDNLLVATRDGKAIKFNETQVRSMGRTARGVRALNMSEGDSVVDMALCKDDTRILTVTETGYGRISNISNYRLQSRGGKGLINYRTDKYGKVAAVLPVEENEDIIMIASNGIIIRIYAGDISEFARPAKGVRVMRVAEGERILSVAKAEHDEAEVTDAPEAADADAGTVEPENDTDETVQAEE